METRSLLKHDSDPSIGQKTPVLWGFIELQPGISIYNYIGMLLHNLISSAVVGAAELLQQNLFTNSEYYDMSVQDGEQLYSYIVIQDLITKLVTVSFYGHLCDSWGRQKSLYLAYIIVSFSCFLFPIYYYDPSMFKSPLWTCIGRFFYSNGSALLQVVPFLADYVENNSKGKAISLNIPLNSLGYMVASMLVNFMSPYNLIYSYVVLFLISTVGGFGYVAILKGGNQYYRTTDPEKQAEEQVNLKLIKKYGEKNHWIYVSFIFSIMAGAGLAMLIQIFNNFIQTFPASNPVAVASSLLSISNIGAAIVSFFVGLTIDYVHQIYPTMLVFVLGSYGFFISWLIQDSQGILMKFVAFSIGIASSTTQLLANYNGFRYYPSDYRGYFFGIASMFNFTGTIIVTGIGGTLFKYCDINWPFFLSGAISVFSVVTFCYFYFKTLRNSKIDIQ